MADEQPVLVDTAAAAAAVGISPATVRQWIHRGLLAKRGTDARRRNLVALADLYRLDADLRRRSGVRRQPARARSYRRGAPGATEPAAGPPPGLRTPPGTAERR